MNLPDRAVEVLLSAERQLVLLAGEAGEARDYDAATALLEAARRVKLLTSNGAATVALPAYAARAGACPPDVNGGPDSLPPATTSRRIRKSDYPKFLRDGDALVKVGWSRTDKSEYQHKSPKKVLLALATALADTGANGRRFTMDQVLPLADPADSSRLPDYQCYLCLAWLRQDGLIIQHGRQGYSLPKNGDLVTAAERAWGQLPSRE